MFTEGLDNSALRWVREGSGNQKKEVPYSVSNLHPRIDPYSNIRSGSGRGVGLPPPSKFRSGHLSGVIPVSRAIPVDIDDSGSASDNDLTVDSEDEVYGGRYSLDSSPPDDRVHNSNTATQGYYNSARKQQPVCASDYIYSDDVSSSRETMGRGYANVADRLTRGANRYSVGRNDYTEDDSSDSAESSEFSTTQVGSTNVAGPPGKAYVSDGYASTAYSRANAETTRVKDSSARNLQNGRLSDDEVPSAPPFCGSVGEIKQTAEKYPTAKTHHTSCNVENFVPQNARDGSEFYSSKAKLEDNTGQEVPDPSVRKFPVQKVVAPQVQSHLAFQHFMPVHKGHGML